MALTRYHNYSHQSRLRPSSIIWVKMSLALMRIWSLEIHISVFQVFWSRFAPILQEWMVCPNIPRSLQEGVHKNFNLSWITFRLNLKHKLNFDISLLKMMGRRHTSEKIVHIQTTKRRLAENLVTSKQHRCCKIWCIPP